ncbi:hypothetical protein BXZ70DRAFT_1013362 [Cristinia sonorae]|uniref:Uncharacterized protein n=1 Tax=Cristinia sonorae TaxID=1940300 RepID=A0A8K0UEN4_9AGAR|nr:hypothetical protein BXZ70DRAFT_1013362 [Cristinia sonorae]
MHTLAGTVDQMLTCVAVCASITHAQLTHDSTDTSSGPRPRFTCAHRHQPTEQRSTHIIAHAASSAISPLELQHAFYEHLPAFSYTTYLPRLPVSGQRALLAPLNPVPRPPPLTPPSSLPTSTQERDSAYSSAETSRTLNDTVVKSPGS